MMRRRRLIGASIVALVLIGLGAAVLVFSVDGVQRTRAVAGSTPVRVLSPEAGATGPAIVLAHGFSGSAAMMDPLGSALARAGHVVVMPDLPGHAGNPAPLGDGVLQRAVSDAVALAAERGHQPVVVAGHSMGAGAVTRWATDNPAGATVAISLPSAEDLPADPASPPNLLLLWGSAEQQRFIDAALAGLTIGYPEGKPGQAYGDFGAGTARRAVPIPGAEHIAIIYRAQTAREITGWIGSGGTPAGDARFVGLVLVLGGVVVAASAIVGDRAPSGWGDDRRDPTARPSAVGTLGWFALAVMVAGVGAGLLQPLVERVPVAVAGYLGAWFSVGALVLIGAALHRRRGRGTWPGLLRGALAGLLLALGLALPARFTWADFAVVGPRWWVLLGLLVVLAAWLWGESGLLVGVVGWRRAGLLAASRLMVVAGLLTAVVLLGAPGFLTLTVPLVIPLLAVLAVVAWWARVPMAAAAAQAIPLALAIATTFPLVA